MPKGGGLRSIQDRQLEERISQAVRLDERMDLDELVGTLRDVYPEYRRQKLNPFTRRVQDAVQQRAVDVPVDAQLTAAQRIAIQESESVVSRGPDSVTPSRLNSSMTRLYQSTTQPSTKSGSAASPAHRATIDGAVPMSTVEAQPIATGACTEPASQTIGSSHSGAPMPAHTTQAQPKESGDDLTPSHPEAERPVAAKTNKKRGKSYESKAKSLKRAWDSAGEAGPAAKRASIVAPRKISYADLGGIDDVLTDIRHLIEYPLMHPEVYAWLGVQPPRGVLLYGPPGCGKTALANAIATECGVPFLRISAPEIVSGMSGESEAKLRQLFADAAAVAPSILFIDEIDAIAPKRESVQREMERRIVAQMLTCMDDLSATSPDLEVSTGSDTAGGDGGNIQPQIQGGQSNGGVGGFGDGGAAARAVTEAAASNSSFTGASVPHVVVIGATNRPDAMDPALRRAGRFDREISLGIPGEAARAEMLRVLCRGLRLGGGVDVCAVARATPGYVGADLSALTKEAAALAVASVFKDLEDSSTAFELSRTHVATGVAAEAAPAPCDVEMHVRSSEVDAVAANVTEVQNGGAVVGGPGGSKRKRGGLRSRGPLTLEELQHVAINGKDFEGALAKVQPSVRREGFSTKPDVAWADVGSLDGIKEELEFSISQPIRHPERFEAMGVPVATGLLLFGPPGCGKTLVAKAAAADCGANFISIKGPELLNKYVGESERAVRQLFARARAARPCVVFFDELDALAPRRGGGGDSSNAAERVVNQLLTELDGTEARGAVFVLAATNRPDMIDPALLRPGRLDKTLYVPLPDAAGRGSIFTALCARSPIAAGVDVHAFAAAPACEGLTGADLASMLREAAVASLKESMSCTRASAPSTITQQGAAHHLTASNVLEGSGSVKEASSVDAAPKNEIAARHLEAALRVTRPSVSKADRALYERLRDKLLSIRSNIAVPAGAETKVAAGTRAHEVGGVPDGAAGARAPGGNQGGLNNSPGDDAMRDVA